MPDNSDSNIATADALTLLLHNQHALAAAIDEVTVWLPAHGVESVADNARLGSHQSALAFQYAKVLEYASNVFGSQKLAEEWLGRPCKYLEVDAPLDIIHNALGYRIVQDYLNRIEYGVYQ